MPNLTDFDAVLQRPFELKEHGFSHGNCFIKKSAIKKRLSQVDPNWRITNIREVTRSENVVVMSGDLVIHGVARQGVGADYILRWARHKDTQEVYDLDPITIAQNERKAYKTAASDILPRAAINFYVGEYLKGIPKWVKSEPDLKKWLAEIAPQYAAPAPAAPQSSPAASAAATTQPTITPAAPSGETPQITTPNGHWANTFGGQRVRLKMNALMLDEAFVLKHLEEGHALSALTDTTLNESQVMRRLNDIAALKQAQPAPN